MTWIKYYYPIIYSDVDHLKSLILINAYITKQFKHRQMTISLLQSLFSSLLHSFTQRIVCGKSNHQWFKLKQKKALKVIGVCCARKACLSSYGWQELSSNSRASQQFIISHRDGIHEHSPTIPGNISCMISATSITCLRYLGWLPQHSPAKSSKNGFLGSLYGVPWGFLPVFQNCAMGLLFGMQSYENVLTLCRLIMMELIHIPSGVHWSMCGTHSSCHFYYQLPV